MRFVYQSFAGRYCDNPRAVHERLLQGGEQHEHVWLADPAHEHTFPDTVTTVRIDDDAAVQALEAADVLVANTHTEVEWRKRDGATYLQTWHGTPLKRVHHDVLWAPEGRLARLDRDVARWDVMVSPNAASTPRLQGAFRFGGPMIETGYPRNDVLVRDDGQRRAKIRAELGVPDGVRAVLYAPTWRDDVTFDAARPQVRLPLDTDRFTQVLGEDWVLLPRLHSMVTDRMPPLQGPGVCDVSWYPEVADLYLAADVLVTDYSSCMFDFAVTGKPILYLAPDLDRFRDSVRGFYFDPLPGLPGPLLTETDQVLDALRDLDAVQERFADRYAAFRATFTSLEDGGSTDRVLQQALGLVVQADPVLGGVAEPSRAD